MSKIKHLVRTIRDYYVIQKSGLFDEDFYLMQNPDVRKADINPIKHYLKYGAFEGRNPNRYFDSEYYLDQSPDVVQKDINPLVHYIRYGENEGRKPSFNGGFDLTSDIANSAQSEHTRKQEVNGTDGKHLLQSRVEKKLDTSLISKDVYSEIMQSGLFDKSWYASQYSSFFHEGEDALNHYLLMGVRLNFDPSENFSTANYLDIYRDVKSSNLNPLYHYIKFGKLEERNPNPVRRNKRSGLRRITPEEYGVSDTILNFDAPAKKIEGIQHEKIAIHLHLYHTNMAHEFVHYLSQVQHSFNLLVSVSNDQQIESWCEYFSSKLPYANEVIVKNVENRGRDVAPWLVDCKSEIRQSTIFCHVHSKASIHNKAHAGWFRYLCHTMLGSVGIVDQILDMFVQDDKVGAIGPCYFWALAAQPNFGRNRQITENLFSRISDLKFPDICPDYPAGSFFWIRTELLNPLFNLNLTTEDFDEEAGQVDGTISHAIERLIGFLPELNNKVYKMVKVDVAYDLVRYIPMDRTNLSKSLVRSPASKKKKFNSQGKKVAVFSCISGDYEKPMSLLSNQKGIDCFFFSDKQIQPPSGSNFILSNYISSEPVRTARFVKTHPHIWFKDYDYVCWIDSNVHFFGDIFEYIDRLEEKNADCGFILHPVRESVYEEFVELVKAGRVDEGLATKQVSNYQLEPEIFTTPLMETNFYICRPNSVDVQQFLNLWWSEINQYTHRDQLSVSFAMYMSKLKWINLIDNGRSTREHPDFVLFDHAFEERDSVIDFIRGNGKTL